MVESKEGTRSYTMYRMTAYRARDVFFVFPFLDENPPEARSSLKPYLGLVLTVAVLLA